MLLAIEFLLFFVGLWALATGTMPLLSFLLLKSPHYDVDKRGVRLLGVVLASTVPLIIGGDLLLQFLLGERALQFVVLFEWALVVWVAVVAQLVGRVVLRVWPELDSRGEVIEESETETLIRKTAHAAWVAALLGGLMIPAIVFCPLALVRSRQAIRMIEEQGVGGRYRGPAVKARTLSIVISLLWGAILVSLIVAAVGGRA